MGCISHYNKTELKSYVCSRIDKKHECFSRTSGTSLSLKIIHQLGGWAKNEGPGPPLSKGFGHVLHKCVTKPTKMVMRHQGGFLKEI